MWRAGRWALGLRSDRLFGAAHERPVATSHEANTKVGDGVLRAAVGRVGITVEGVLVQHIAPSR